MMKQIKWNKKRKWQDTRYCKPFRARLAFRRANAAMMAATSLFHMRAIASQPATDSLGRENKALAMGNLVANTANSIAVEISKGGGK